MINHRDDSDTSTSSPEDANKIPSRRQLLALGGTAVTALMAAACAEGAEGGEGAYQFGTIQQALGTNPDVDAVETLADLKAITPGTSDPQVYVMLGRDTAGDGGGGIFYWSAGDTDPDDDGTIIEPNPGGGRWRRLVRAGWVNVAWFGARADYHPSVGYQDNSAPFQAALDSLRDRFGTGTVYVPPGRYGFDGPVLLRTALQGLTIQGPARNETSDAELVNNSSGLPLFRSDDGSTSFITFEDLSFRAESGAGHIIQSTHGMNAWTIRRVFYYLYEATASFLNHGKNGSSVASSVSTFIIDEVIGKSLSVAATVPQIEMTCTPGYVLSNIQVRSALFLTQNSSTSAPQIRLVNEHSSANCGCQFEHIVMQSAFGGGIHLHGINNVLINSLTDADTGPAHNPVILLLKKNISGQGNLTATIMESRIEGIVALENDYPAEEWPSLTVIGGWLGTLDNQDGYVHCINARIANYTAGAQLPLRIKRNMLLGVEGIRSDHTAVASRRPLTGTHTVPAGDLNSFVPFAPLAELSGDYNVFLSGPDSDNYWVGAQSASGFYIRRPSATPPPPAVDVKWLVVT